MAADPLIVNDQLVDSLRGALSRGEAGLRTVPQVVKAVILNEAWRRRTVTRTGEVVMFTSFADFVAAPPLGGLGADIRTLKNICQDDRQAIDLLDQALVAAASPGHRSDLVDIVNEVEHPDGNSSQAALRRLRKDRADLHAKVLAGEISAHAAMVEAGFRPQTATVRLDDMERAAAALRRRLTDEQRQELIEFLG